MKLEQPVYPQGVVIEAKVNDDEALVKKAYDEAIPEFIRFNIVECDIRGVV